VNAHSPEFELPPFAMLASLGPAQVADAMVACFARLGARPDRLENAHALALRSLGIPLSERLALAGQAVARDIDAGVGAGVASGYHNPQHFLEVMLSALYLARLERLDAYRSARVVTAGLIHDFHHDGSGRSSTPFRLEQLAWQMAEPYLRHANVDAGTCDGLEALVLATEARAGVPYARACWQHHRGAGPAAQSGANLPRQIERLAADGELASDAVLLAEADILPSIGLTPSHSNTLQARLAAEWGTTFCHEDKLQFIDRMVSDTVVSQFFIPNVRRFRDSFAPDA
jgi:hypothetical protein